MKVEIAGLSIDLTTEQEEDLRRQLDVRRPESTGRLLTAAQLAAQLDVSREYVYSHAEELGGQKLGDGYRGRWRFPAATQGKKGDEPPPLTRSKTKKRRPQGADRIPLLAVRGVAPYAAAITKAALGGAETPTEGLTKGRVKLLMANAEPTREGL